MPGCESLAVCIRACVGIMMVAGLVLSFLALASCEFFSYDFSDATLGLLQIGVAGECETYNQDDFNLNDWHMTARVTGVLAPILALVAFLIFLFESCCCKVCCSQLFISVFLQCATIAQGLTFTLYKSTFCDVPIVGQRCDFGNGALFAAIAGVLFLTSGFTICCGPKPTPLVVMLLNREKGEKSDEEVEEKDGQEDDKAAEEQAPEDEETPEDDGPPEDEGPSAGDDAPENEEVNTDMKETSESHEVSFDDSEESVAV